MVGKTNRDGISVLEPSKLLEGFGSLELPGGKGRDGRENDRTVGVHPDMLVVWRASEPLVALDTPAIRNGGAAKVKGRPAIRTNDFNLVGVEEVVEAFNGLGEGSNLDLRVGEAVHKGLHLRRENEWLVALDVNHDIEVPAKGLANASLGLVTTIGAATVSGGRHDGMTAKTLNSLTDALVVRGNVNVRRDGRGFLVNMLNHGLAIDEGEGLAGETGGGVTGGD